MPERTPWYMTLLIAAIAAVCIGAAALLPKWGISDVEWFKTTGTACVGALLALAQPYRQPPN